MQAFLAHGVKISERQRGLGLMNAANGGHFEIVQALLSGGAQIS